MSHHRPARSAPAVLNTVSLVTGVSIKDIKGRLRPRRINDARGVAIWSLSRHALMTDEQIAEVIGGRDVSTITDRMNAILAMIMVHDPIALDIMAVNDLLNPITLREDHEYA